MNELNRSEVKDGIEKMRAELEEFKKTYRKELQEKFQEAIKVIFDEYENLDWISWSQGTPGWCDGEPCSFELHGLNLSVNGVEHDYREDLEYLRTQEEIDANPRYKEWGYEAGTPEQFYAREVGDHVNGILESVSDILAAIYGDPVEIKIKRNLETEVDYYELDW